MNWKTRDIYSVPGKGSFASGDARTDERRKEELKHRFRELAAELRYLGTSQQELMVAEGRKGEQP